VVAKAVDSAEFGAEAMDSAELGAEVVDSAEFGAVQGFHIVAVVASHNFEVVRKVFATHKAQDSPNPKLAVARTAAEPFAAD
jgi:hypothetical protein